MPPDEMLRTFGESTFTLGPLGGCFMIGIVLFIVFVIARPPRKSDFEGNTFDQVHAGIGAFGWLLILFVGLIVIAGVVGATFGVQVIPSIRPGAPIW